MKKYLLSLALIITLNAHASEITSIDGAANICPTGTTTYTARYTLLYNPLGGVFETVTKVRWDFIHNGAIIKTLYSDEYIPTGMVPGYAKIKVSGLPLGDIKIKVKISAVIQMGMGGGLVSYEKSKNIFVGVPAAGAITGTPICPNSSGTFSIDPVPFATSYTWEVPSGWKVNGIPGPVVTTLGTSVSITPCPFANGSSQPCETTLYTNYTIKVKGVSATCGTGESSTRKVTVDYPVTITETNLSSNNVKLSATPSNLPGYNWALDAAWYFPTTGNKNLPDITFNSRGVTGLAKLTYTTHCQNTYTRDWWWVVPAQPGDPGWPGDPQDPDPGDCEPEIPTTPSYFAKSGNVIFLRDPCSEEPPVVSLYANNAMKRVTLNKSLDGYEYDISGLKSGMYIMHIKTAKGKHKTMKFIKVN